MLRGRLDRLMRWLAAMPVVEATRQERQELVDELTRLGIKAEDTNDGLWWFYGDQPIAPVSPPGSIRERSLLAVQGRK